MAGSCRILFLTLLVLALVGLGQNQPGLTADETDPPKPPQVIPPSPPQVPEDPSPEPPSSTKKKSENLGVLKITITGPQNGTVNNPITFQVNVTNTGRTKAEKVVLLALPDVNLDSGTGSAVLHLSVGTLAAGETRSVPVQVNPRQAGKMSLRIVTVQNEAVVEVQGNNSVQIIRTVEQAIIPPSTQPVPLNVPAPPLPPPAGFGFPGSGGPRFQFNIDPKTTVKDLLPTPPKTRPAGLVLIDELTQVPELAFQEALPKNTPSHKAQEHIAHGIAKINHLNKEKTDAFMVALVNHRSDLAGLPFVMGDDCRLKEERSRQFNSALANLRVFMGQNVSVSIGEADQAPQKAADFFWTNYQTHCDQQDRANPRNEKILKEQIVPARIAALMQVCGPQTGSMRKGLVKYLAGLSHIDATRALAKLAIFSAEDEVRQAALETLKIRREKDYTDILLQGLRYPFPAVAQRASEALVKLERTDLIENLVAFLDEPDPRAPVVKEVDNKKVAVVRELVKINHHRNCLMCHAPGSLVPNVPQVSGPALQPPGGSGSGPPFPMPNAPPMVQDIPQGAIPIPGEPLPSPSSGYQSSTPDILVRIDVTYLRQDFSLMLPVADAQPWPEMQRFDFLVRTRVLADNEAKDFREKLNKRSVSPYQQMTVAALRELTGRNAEPTAEAWRKLLKGSPASPR